MKVYRSLLPDWSREIESRGTKAPMRCEKVWEYPIVSKALWARCHFSLIGPIKISRWYHLRPVVFMFVDRKRVWCKDLVEHGCYSGHGLVYSSGLVRVTEYFHKLERIKLTERERSSTYMDQDQTVEHKTLSPLNHKPMDPHEDPELFKPRTISRTNKRSNTYAIYAWHLPRHHENSPEAKKGRDHRESQWAARIMPGRQRWFKNNLGSVRQPLST